MGSCCEAEGIKDLIGTYFILFFSLSEEKKTDKIPLESFLSVLSFCFMTETLIQSNHSH